MVKNGITALTPAKGLNWLWLVFILPNLEFSVGIRKEHLKVVLETCFKYKLHE